MEEHSSTPVQHLVLFRWPGDPEPQLEAEMRRQISEWIGVIPGLLRLRFGRDVGGRADGFQFGLLTEFSDAPALSAYLAHPVHQSFLNWVRERPFDVIRFDYPLTPETSLFEPRGG
ncbi:MAG: Dabb family protein [Candidatus Dormiibacterota bacterium]